MAMARDHNVGTDQNVSPHYNLACAVEYAALADKGSVADINPPTSSAPLLPPAMEHDAGLYHHRLTDPQPFRTNNFNATPKGDSSIPPRNSRKAPTHH